MPPALWFVQPSSLRGVPRRLEPRRWPVSPAVAIACAALVAIALGAWIGTGIGHRRAERKAQQADARAERREARQERSSAALDEALDRANRRLLQAARAGQSRAVARAEAALVRASRRADAADGGRGKLPKRPYAREVERFAIKRPPLVAQQITSSDDDHVLFVAVQRAYFCFKTAPERVRSVREVYLPIRRRLARAGVHDFEMVVGPPSSRAPTRSTAFAIARGSDVRLTGRGRRC